MWRTSIRAPERNCAYGLSRCGVDSRSNEFSRLVGNTPEFAILVEDKPDVLGAHEAATFVDEGRWGAQRPSIIFTTKPFLPEGAELRVVDIKRLDLTSGKIALLWRSENLANGGTIGPDGNLYFAFQGQTLPDAAGEQALGGVFSIESGAPVNSAPGRKRARDDCEEGAAGDEMLPVEGWRLVVNRWGSHAFNSPNDVVVRREDGSVWFTDPSYGFHQGFRPQPTLGDWVWRHDPATGSTAVVGDGFSRPNGLCFSPDERTLYVTDTGHATGREGPEAIDPAGPRSVYAFDVTANGHLSGRRLLYVADRGIPDGIKVDKAGRIYTGCEDGVHVLDAHGSLLGKILVKGCEGGAANLCFGRGAYASTLFILAEGAIISIRLHGAEGAI